MPQEKGITKLWKIEELAEYLGVPRTWIYDRTQENFTERIPHYKLGKYLIQATGADAGVTLRKFSDGLWQSYLRNKGVKSSTVYGHQSCSPNNVLPVLATRN